MCRNQPVQGRQGREGWRKSSGGDFLVIKKVKEEEIVPLFLLNLVVSRCDAWNDNSHFVTTRSGGLRTERICWEWLRKKTGRGCIFYDFLSHQINYLSLLLVLLLCEKYTYLYNLTPLSWGLFLAAGKNNCNGYIPFLSYRVILIRTSLGWPVQ